MKTIALVGPPCSGKTKTLERILQNDIRFGFSNVVCGAEIAEKVLKRNPLIRQNPWEFQSAIFHCQTEIEDAYRSLFKDTDTLLIMDRGLADLAVYLPDQAEKFMVENNTSLQRIFERYDAVYLLEAADPNQYQSTTIRTESADEAQSLDELTKKVWCRHPKCFVVHATERPEDKVINAIKLITETIATI